MDIPCIFVAQKYGFRLRFFIEIAYDGSSYHGWQKQPGAISVQEVLEDALGTVFQKKIKTVGAGRTDTGVHATQFYAHFDAGTVRETKQLVFKLNTILPEDIAVFGIFEVRENAHARFDAVLREYTYYVNTKKNPFRTGSSYYIKKKIVVERMNEAAQLLMEHTDFKAFSKVKTEVRTYNCKIHHAAWRKDGDNLVFEISADRFLRNMVRAIVGTLIDVGTNKTSMAEMHKIIEGRNRCCAGKSVPAHALFLTKVEYPTGTIKK